MAQNSKIEWTHHTANLWHGCTKVHEGCDNCYAETLAKRWGNDIWGNDKPRKEIKSVWNELLKMQKLAKQANEVHRVFIGSMMDIFEKPMPIIGSAIPEYTTGVLRDRLFDQINKGLYPNLMFLLLTKRPSNINKMIPEFWKGNPPINVMYGTSISTQANAEKLIPQLLSVNGKLFLSIEPQLEEIKLRRIKIIGSTLEFWDSRFGEYGISDILNGTFYKGKFEYSGKKIDWIIQGGESGHHKRPFNLEWARSMRDECQALKVPYFFKQIDKIQQIPDDLLIQDFPKETVSSAFC